MKPSILLLLADQWRFDALGAGGCPEDVSPNLDQMAREGIRFSHAFTPTALCSPARASLFTGRYPHRHRVLNNTHDRDALVHELPEGERTAFQYLRDAGYHVAYTGKWHVGRKKDPAAWGAHEYRTGHERVRPSRAGRVLEDPCPLLLPAVDTGCPGEEKPFHARITGAVEETIDYGISETTIDVLRRLAEDRDRPFFVTASWQQPHWPQYIPQPYADLFDPARIPPWPNFGDTFDGKPRVNRELVREWGVEGVPWDVWAKCVARYWGNCRLIDDQIGRILAALDDLGLSEKTMVVFTSDHGDLTGSHGLFNKGRVPYEEIYRVPLLVRGPGVSGSGRECNAFVNLVDLLPTWLEVAGIERPGNIDGRSVLPFLRGATPADWPDAVFMSYSGEEIGLASQRILRDRRYKYVYTPHDMDELYDLEQDPAELRNLIDDSGYRETGRLMARRLHEWMVGTGDMIAPWARVMLVDRWG